MRSRQQSIFFIIIFIWLSVLTLVLAFNASFERYTYEHVGQQPMRINKSTGVTELFYPLAGWRDVKNTSPP